MLFYQLTFNHFLNHCNMLCGFCCANKTTQSIAGDYKTFLDKYSIFKRINFVGGKTILSRKHPEIFEQASSIAANCFALLQEYNYSFRTLSNIFGTKNLLSENKSQVKELAQATG